MIDPTCPALPDLVGKPFGVHVAPACSLCSARLLWLLYLIYLLDFLLFTPPFPVCFTPRHLHPFSFLPLTNSLRSLRRWPPTAPFQRINMLEKTDNSNSLNELSLCRHRTISGLCCRLPVRNAESHLCFRHAQFRQKKRHAVDLAYDLAGQLSEFTSAADIKRASVGARLRHRTMARGKPREARPWHFSTG